MCKSWWNVAVGVVVLILLLPLGCSNPSGPKEPSSSSSLQTVLAVVTQDRAQLSLVGLTTNATTAELSIGWKQFVAPDVLQEDTVGEAYAIARPESVSTRIHPDGLDMGTVTLGFTGGSIELTKHIAPDSGVVYWSFGKGFHLNATSFVNIPFVPSGLYTFTVSGSSAYSAGTFEITAPSSLLAITGHANGDTISAQSDLNLTWSGGSGTDSVLVRIVPHLPPDQAQFLEGRDSLCIPHDQEGGHRPRGHREGKFMMGGPLSGMGPEFDRGVVVMLPNTGSYTLTVSDLATLLNGTTAAELMVGVSQVVKQDVPHDGGTTTVLLRCGDRMVLHVR
jgi:hypothetical protein